MDLRTKYQQLISYAQQANVKNLLIEEKNNVLNISGTATANTKNMLWDMYKKIDPDMRAGDLLMNIQEDASLQTTYTVKAGDNLSKIAKHYPGMTWQKIFEANKTTIKDPDKIFPGQEIIIPV